MATALVLAGLLTSGCTKSPPSPEARARFVDAVVTNNFRLAFFLLHEATGQDIVFPKTLAELNSSNLDTKLFICPGTRSEPGSMQSVEEWSDYIYVGKALESIPGTALLISPPENHAGDYGYVLLVGLAIRRLPGDVPQNTHPRIPARHCPRTPALRRSRSGLVKGIAGSGARI